MNTDKRAALLSMDKKALTALLKAEKHEVPKKDRDFWILVHGIRAHSLELPRYVRQESQAWLRENG